ncbi:efflux RND transporter periplasmic adaptor subunit [Sphingobium algorifonticola]|uniref:Efflux RND transporter periplasmic adaptor subunit n=1 Tax=Sphingobium algorifonticola TaxID=2008318 RepID=A0A437J8Z2_9SPHN|nr:efflux RND transporter periplasmic adaptor subunit [Sphingobium algorifonticola]RVT41964.1 efflux RND transporter periplasmic adaptor subunit [Sphingobium algorifonticola]
MSQDTISTPGGSADNLDDFLGVKPSRPVNAWIKWGLVALGVVLLVLLLMRMFGGEDKPNYSTRAVRKGDLTVTVSATGNLKPINQVDVGSEQSGKITQVFVDVNDRVTKGQRLAELDTRRLRDSVMQNRSQVASAQASVAQADAQVALAKATLDRQLNVFQLSGGRVPAKTEMDSARASYAQALAQRRSADAQVAVAQAQLSSAQTNLDIAQIISPVTGVVLSRSIEPGQTVAASFNAPVLFTIAEDLKQMEVEVSVDEADVGQVAEGQEATFTVDAFPGRRFPARVNRVNVGSNASSAASSSTTTTTATNTVVAYTAVLSVSNEAETLRPGMTATADIVTKQLRDVLLVPNAALRFKPSQGARSGGGITSQLVARPRRGNRATQEVSFGAGSSQTVYIVDENGDPKAVNVVIGDSDGSRTVILSGDIKDGTRVITGQLAPGQEQPPERDEARGGQPGGDRGKRDARPAATPAPAAPSPSAPSGNSAAPAPAPATETGPATGRAAATPAPASSPPPALPGGARLRDMTPEQRRAFLDSLTPEQRAEMRARRDAWRAERNADGE